jgi:hypothetical protein
VNDPVRKTHENFSEQPSAVKSLTSLSLYWLLATTSRHQALLEEADEFPDVLMNGRVRGLVQPQADVQGRDRHGLEKPVEQRIQEKQHGFFGDSGPQFPPALGPAHQGSEIFRGVAPHRGQKLFPERHILIELNLQIKAENPGMLPGEGDPGQEGFFQPGKKILFQGLFLDRGQGAPYQVESVLEDIGKNPLFVGEILVERSSVRLGNCM